MTNSDALAVDAAAPDSPCEARDSGAEGVADVASSAAASGDDRFARPSRWRRPGANPADDIRRAEAWLAERQIGPIV